MIKAGENSLDEALKERGYCIVDPTNIWSISAEALSNIFPDLLRSFRQFPIIFVRLGPSSKV